MSALYRNILVLVSVLLGGAACGSIPKDPPKDDPFGRTMDVANEAVFYGRLQQAQTSYQKSFDYAITRDDVQDIDDAGYNLAVVQLGLGNTDGATDTINRTRNELSIRGQQNSPQLDLVTAGILYRVKRLSEAASAAQKAAISEHEDIQERAYFLSGLIADMQGNLAQLQAFSRQLDQLVSKGSHEDDNVFKADQDELHALLAYKQGQYAQAITDAVSVETLRREQIDYRSMARALVIEAQANQAMGKSLDAARLYVRAGQTAALLKEYDDASRWLGVALSLHGGQVTDQLANAQLTQIAKEKSKPVE